MPLIQLQLKNFLWFLSSCFTFTLLLFYLFPNRFFTLHEHWFTIGDLNTGYILLFGSLYFAYKNIDSKKLEASYLTLLLILPLSLAFFIADFLDIKSLFFITLAASYPIFLAATLGYSIARSTLIPLGLVIMALPFWYLALDALQSMTVFVVQHLLRFSSITAFFEGNVISLPSGMIHIAKGCSGHKYLISSITLALIMSCLSNLSLLRTLFLTITAAIASMVGNWIRVYILVLVGNYYGIDHPLMADHDSLGWVIFFIVIALWIASTNRISVQKSLITPPEETHASPPQPITANTTNLQANSKIIIVFSLILALFYLPFLIKNQLLHINGTQNYTIPSMENTLGNAHFQPPKNRQWQPGYIGVTHRLTSHYLLNEQIIEVNILSYPNHIQHELASSDNHIFHPDYWQVISETKIKAEASDSFKLRKSIGKSHLTGQYYVVYHWYNHGSWRANTVLMSKYYQLISVFSGIATSELVTLSLPCNILCVEGKNPVSMSQLSVLALSISSKLHQLNK